MVCISYVATKKGKIGWSSFEITLSPRAACSKTPETKLHEKGREGLVISVMDQCLRHLAQFLARYQWLLDTYVIVSDGLLYDNKNGPPRPEQFFCSM